MVRKQLCDTIFKPDFVASVEQPCEVGIMILCYRGGNWDSAAKQFPEEHTAFPWTESIFSQLQLIPNLLCCIIFLY